MAFEIEWLESAERELNASCGESAQEDLWHALEQDPELLLKPSEIEAKDGETIDLETFRADLHKMIDEVNAEV